jgi:ABC-2 type transport system permease protein
MLAMLLVVPVLQVTVFGYAANLELDHVDVVYVDERPSEASRAFFRALGAEGTFRLRPVPTVHDAEEALRAGEASMAVILPFDYERRLLANRPLAVQALLDGSDPLRGQGAGAAFEQLVASHARSFGAAPPAIAVEPRLLYNPGLKSRLFMVPGTAASVLVIVTTVVTAMGLAREREVGTMEQLLVTPMSSGTLMVGKTIPYALLGLADELLIILVGNLLFDVPIRGLAVLLLGAIAYLVSTLGVGLFIATVARTQQQAIMGGFFFLLPAILLSGFLTPVESMPAWVQLFTYANPVRYFVDLCRSVLLRRADLADTVWPLTALVGLGAGLLSVAAVRFRRQIA